MNYANWLKTITCNNKFLERSFSFDEIIDLLEKDIEFIYKIIMMRNNWQETFINNYENNNWTAIITFWKTTIYINNL